MSRPRTCGSPQAPRLTGQPTMSHDTDVGFAWSGRREGEVGKRSATAQQHQWRRGRVRLSRSDFLRAKPSRLGGAAAAGRRRRFYFTNYGSGRRWSSGGRGDRRCRTILLSVSPGQGGAKVRSTSAARSGSGSQPPQQHQWRRGYSTPEAAECRRSELSPSASFYYCSLSGSCVMARQARA